MNANTRELDRLLETARKATREKELGTVIDACEKALEIAPGDSRFEFMQGAALRRAGDYEKAEPLLRSTIESAPAFAAAHLELGLNLLPQGHLAAARRSLETAVKLDA
ncbi:MAG: sulfotransferase family protein, partial [Gammaproteobacteria bacterium]|nr:sulfotransferase family protein [Gammaproteobacteria bacterium]